MWRVWSKEKHLRDLQSEGGRTRLERELGDLRCCCNRWRTTADLRASGEEFQRAASQATGGEGKGRGDRWLFIEENGAAFDGRNQWDFCQGEIYCKDAVTARLTRGRRCWCVLTSQHVLSARERAKHGTGSERGCWVMGRNWRWAKRVPRVFFTLFFLLFFFSFSVLFLISSYLFQIWSKLIQTNL
jgi:hypothetical protein